MLDPSVPSTAVCRTEAGCANHPGYFGRSDRRAQRGETNPQTSSSKTAWPMVDFRLNSSWFERLYRKLPEAVATRFMLRRTGSLAAHLGDWRSRHRDVPLGCSWLAHIPRVSAKL